MRGLKICLWIAGIACLLSVVGMFMPISAGESIAKAFGAEEFLTADSPVLEYLVRLMSATYVAVGVFFVILALGPMDYGIIVPFSGVAAAILGLVCVITGAVIGMPILWFLGDGVPCLILGVLIVVCWRKAKQAP